MTVHTQKKVMKILYDIKPYYDLFWNKNKHYLDKFIKKANPIINGSGKVRSLIESIKIFYGTTWPKDKAFPIGLYLIPKTEKISRATSFDTFEEAAIKPGEELYNRLGVIIHEMCHSYYVNQESSLYNEMKKYYKLSKNLFSHHAYNYMNESLATVLGNGIAYKAMLNKVNKYWYNDEIIDGFAHALYPMTVDYIENKKKMDTHYFKESIIAFKNKFPNMNKRLKSLLNNSLFSTTGDIDINTVELPLSKKTGIYSSHFSSPFVHKFTRKYFDSSKSPLILIVDDWGEIVKEGIKNMYPEVSKEISAIVNSKKGWGYFFENNRFYLIIKYVDQKQYLSIIEEIGKKSVID